MITICLWCSPTLSHGQLDPPGSMCGWAERERENKAYHLRYCCCIILTVCTKKILKLFTSTLILLDLQTNKEQIV